MIETNNQSFNVPMPAVNDRLGFVRSSAMILFVKTFQQGSGGGLSVV